MADWMRNTVKTTLGPALATIQNRVETRSPTGGTTYTWTPGDSGYCNVAPMSTEEMELAGRMAVNGTVACRVGFDLDVDNKDRILISGTDADELDGLWEVTAVLVGYPAVDRLLFLARST